MYIQRAHEQANPRLLADAGKVAAEYQDAILRNLPSKRVQCDEIWSFVYGKDRNIPREIRESSPFTVGSVWTWTAIDCDSKLMLSWFVGSRDEWSAEQFIRDLASRLADKVQMTTDGLKLYLNAIEGAFGGDIDYAMLTKLYGASGDDKSPETRTHRDGSKAWRRPSSRAILTGSTSAPRTWSEPT